MVAGKLTGGGAAAEDVPPRVRKASILERSLRHSGVVPIERRGNVADEVWDLDIIDVRSVHVTETRNEHDEHGIREVVRALLPPSGLDEEDVGGRVFRQAMC